MAVEAKAELPSRDDRLPPSVEASSARFREAASNLGGVLTNLGKAARQTAVGAALLGLAAFGANMISATHPAQAEGAHLPAQQCENAISISTVVMHRYVGRMSADLARSFGKFRDSHCDLSTPFTRVEGTIDDQAYGEFRVLLIRMRKEAANRQTELAVK